MAKKKNTRNTGNQVTFAEWVVWAYMAMMLGVFPFYYQNGYYDMGDAKYLFFRNVTLGMLALVLVSFVCTLLVERGKNMKRPQLSLMDRIVLAYMAAALISWILSPYSAEAWTGSSGWYMGLLSQLLFVGIYFCVSRFGSDRKWVLWLTGVSGMLTFAFGYLHRFGVDPLGLYEGIPERRRSFLGTIGQPTWYSSYVCIALSMMMGFYIIRFWEDTSQAKKERLLTAGFLFLGFCSAVTQNSDSIYIGIGLAFVFLLWYALGALRIWKQYMEVVLTAVLAAKITGILRTVFAERARKLDRLSLIVTNGKIGWVILAAAVLIYAAACWTENRPAAWREKGRVWVYRFRIVFFAVLFLAACSVPVLMWLVTTGRITEKSDFWIQTGYLAYNEGWGTGRGRTWSYCVRVFAEYSPVMKLFGCGPDALDFYSSAYHAEELRSMWGGQKLTNAHNEWLNALIDYGIVGAVSYISVFAAAFIRSVINRKNQPYLIALGTAVLALAGHNFFCYQQAVCTPLIFIIIGMIEYLIRKSKSGTM